MWYLEHEVVFAQCPRQRVFVCAEMEVAKAGESVRKLYSYSWFLSLQKTQVKSGQFKSVIKRSLQALQAPAPREGV